jgi:hypothetical protein
MNNQLRTCLAAGALLPLIVYGDPTLASPLSSPDVSPAGMGSPVSSKQSYPIFDTQRPSSVPSSFSGASLIATLADDCK